MTGYWPPPTQRGPYEPERGLFFNIFFPATEFRETRWVQPASFRYRACEREDVMETMERKELARVIRGGRWAALATYGDGVPLASMVAYACEADFGGFLLHLSRLSLHTRNLLAYPSASIAISEPDTAQVRNPQTLARVSILGEARPFQEDSPGYAEAKALYEKRFPDSSPLFGFGDFLLFRFLPREARFVAGFARAYTVSVGELKEAAAAGLDR